MSAKNILSSQSSQSALEEIQVWLQKHLPGRIFLDVVAAVARLDFLLHLASWLIRAASILMELVLLVASPIIMVSVSLPGFDATHPSVLYVFALKALIAAADVLVPGGLFSIIEKFKHEQGWWGAFLALFWVTLTALTFLALATPMGVMHMSEDGLKKLLYWRTLVSLVYSALSLVAIVYTVRKQEPALTPEQEDALATLSERVNNLATVVGTQKTVDHHKIAASLLPLLPQFSMEKSQENLVTPEDINAVEKRILVSLKEQNNDLIQQVIQSVKEAQFIPEITTFNSPVILEGIQGDKTPEITREITPEIATGINEVITPEITTVIPPVKSQELRQEKPDYWTDAIAKFPSVIEWQAEGLRSVTVEQIIEVTNFSKNKIGRAKLAQTRNGNKRIENVLIWLVKEAPITPVILPEITSENNEGKKTTITDDLTPVINEDVSQENTSGISEVNSPEITEELEPAEPAPSEKKSKNTIKLSIDDLPVEYGPQTDPELVAISE